MYLWWCILLVITTDNDTIMEFLNELVIKETANRATGVEIPYDL